MPNPEDFRYLKSHEWASLEGGSAVVGISDHAQHEITDVVFVEMPKVGRQVKQGESCGVIESVKAAFDLYAPLSGEVSAVNDAVVKDPSLVNRSPHKDGWLYKLKASKPEETKALMDFAAYSDFIKTADAGH